MDVEAVYNEMVEMFGELPNPDHHPIQFAYKYKLYKFYKSRSKKTDIEKWAKPRR